MARDLRSHWRYQEAQYVLSKVMGTHRAAFVGILALLIAVSIAASGFRTLLHDVLAPLNIPTWVLDLLPLILLVAVLSYLACRGPSQQRPKIVEYVRPEQTRALILFLSPPPRPPHPILDVLAGGQSAQLSDPEFLSTLGRAPWRMPLQAIAYHAAGSADGSPGALERVVVIGSSDREPGDGSGTIAQLGMFRELVEKLRAADPRCSSFQIVDLHRSIRQERMKVVKDYSVGVDFERPQELEEAIYHAYFALNKLGFSDESILVDVTGGQKPASIAGAVVALAKQRCIQYVSTHDYRVRAYNVTFEP